MSVTVAANGTVRGLLFRILFRVNEGARLLFGIVGPNHAVEKHKVEKAITALRTPEHKWSPAPPPYGRKVKSRKDESEWNEDDMTDVEEFVVSCADGPN